MPPSDDDFAPARTPGEFWDPDCSELGGGRLVFECRAFAIWVRDEKPILDRNGERVGTLQAAFWVAQQDVSAEVGGACERKLRELGLRTVPTPTVDETTPMAALDAAATPATPTVEPVVTPAPMDPSPTAAPRPTATVLLQLSLFGEGGAR